MKLYKVIHKTTHTVNDNESIAHSIFIANRVALARAEYKKICRNVQSLNVIAKKTLGPIENAVIKNVLYESTLRNDNGDYDSS